MDDQTDLEKRQKKADRIKSLLTAGEEEVVTLEHVDKVGFVLENKFGERRVWNNGMNSLVEFIAQRSNNFRIPKDVFTKLPNEAVDYEFTFRIDVRSRKGESEEEVYHWIQNAIANIPDVVEVYER